MKDHNENSPELAGYFAELPSVEDSKEYLKLRMLQLTEIASVLLCTDPSNVKILDFLQKQIPATYRLLTEDAPVVASSEASNISFDFEDTNYQAVAVDAFGVPLSSANGDTEELP